MTKPSKRAPRADREVRGKGRHGVAFGGVGGDGDVQLCPSAEVTRSKAMQAFAELLSPQAPLGSLVRGGRVSVDDARAAMTEADAQLSGWLDQVDGSYLDVEVPVALGDGVELKLRVGVFRCWYGPSSNGLPAGNYWWIPPAVRLPHGVERRVDIGEKRGRKAR